MNRNLIESLIEAFIQTGKVKPVLPKGQRDEVIATITPMMVNTSLLQEYIAALNEERRRRGVDQLLAEREFLELPIDEILHGGLTSLPDDQLAELACRPVALACLHELVDEMLDDDDKAGNFWWEEIDRQETGTPDDVSLTESQQRTIERLKLLDAINDGAAKGVLPIPERRPTLRSQLRPGPGLLALAASLLVGVLLGGLVFRGAGLRPSTGGMEVLLASVTPKFGTLRGSERSLLVEVASVRPGFATIITLAPDRPQQVFPEPGESPIRVAQSAPQTYGPLPRDSTTALVLITETPATDLIREVLLSQEFMPDNLDRLDGYVRKLLSQSGYRWVGMSYTPIVQRESK